MGRGKHKQAARRAGARERPSGPATGVHEINTGTCELSRDRFARDGWILTVNGAESSHVDPADPQRLDFEYMRWFAALIEPRWRDDARLRVLHLGAGACSMARYLADAYPRSRQVAVEIDGELARLVREWFDLPRAPRLRLRVGDARAVLESLRADTRELIIRDVFSGAATPAEVTTAEFTEQVRRVLVPGGIYMVNCADTRSLAMARREAATIAQSFAHAVMVADPAMLAGRRTGNVVIAGSDEPLGETPGTLRTLLYGAVPATLWDTGKVVRFASGSRVLRDAGPAVFTRVSSGGTGAPG